MMLSGAEYQAAEEVKEILELLEKRKASNRLNLYFQDKDVTDEKGIVFYSRDKYPKQMEFFKRGKDTFARMFSGANGVGKTETALYEACCHLRGWYPDWWEGLRFNRPVDFWICGLTSQTVRDIQQKKLLGDPYKEGAGMMPAEWIDFDSITRSGVPGAIDTFQVLRADGGYSIVSFKSYHQGVGPFFGPEKDGILLDEPPPALIFSECVARTRNRPGAFVAVTVAPKEGNTETVKLFHDKADPSRVLIRCGWAEVPHLTEEWKANTRASTPSYLLPATEFGIPGRGAGAVYPVEESNIVIQPLKMIPKHWKWMFAMDGGYHNTAVGWYAYDRDTDTVYLVDEYKDGGVGTDISVHATRIMARNKAFGFPDMPGVGDLAAINQSDGKKLISEYRKYGLNVTLATKAVDLGIGKTLARMNNGRFKVYSTCTKWLEEFRNYSTRIPKDGGEPVIVKLDDHLMDQTRFAIMDIERLAASPMTTNKSYFKELSFG